MVTILTITPIKMFYRIILLPVLLLVSNYSSSQSRTPPLDVTKLLQIELERHLYPPFASKDTSEIVLFSIKPEVEPDASFRIINICEKSYLEVRVLDQNVWVELLTSLNKHGYNPLSIKTHYYLVPVSKKFENKIVGVFLKVNASNNNQVKIYSEGKPIQNSFDFFDGSSYRFSVTVDKKKQETRILVNEKDPYNADHVDSADYIYQVKLANVRIINDVRNDTFKESNYDIYK